MRYAVASTAWSLPSTWDGGLTIPAAGEVVHANGFTVNIDMNITVVSLNTSANAPAVAGGGFTVTVGGRTINANIIPGTTVCLTVSNPTGTTTVNGNVTSVGTINAIAFTGAGILDVNGNIVAGTTGDGIACTGGGDINLIGNLTGGTAAAGNGIAVTSLPADITVIGTITGGSATTAYGLSTTVGGTLVQSGGNIVGGPTSSGGSAILASTVRFDMNISGDVIPTTNGTYVITHSGVDSLTSITGTLGGYVGATGGPIINFSGATCTHTIIGNIIAGAGGSTGQAAISGAGTSATITGTLTGGTGIALSVSATGTIIINGNIVSGTTANGMAWSAAAPGVLIVNGNISNVATAVNTYGLSLTGTGTVTVNGDSAGGINMVTGANGIHSTGIGATVTVTGTATGGTGANATYGVSFAAVGTYKVGTAKSNNFPNDGLSFANVGVNCLAGISCTLDAMEFGSGGVCPISTTGYFFVRAAGTNTVKMRESNAGLVYTMGDLVNDFPAVTDVRFNVAYNSGSQIGTCHVPGAASTIVGVNVDHTIGTAAITSSAISSAVWDFLLASAITPDSFGALVKLLALTTDVTTAQSAIISAINNSETNVTTAITNSETNVTTAITNSETNVITAVDAIDLTTIENGVGALTTSVNLISDLLILMDSKLDNISGDIDTIEVTTNQMISLLETVRKFNTNRSKIDSITKTLTIYEDDGTTPLKAFILKNSVGSASIQEVTERAPI